MRARGGVAGLVRSVAVRRPHETITGGCACGCMWMHLVAAVRFNLRRYRQRRRWCAARWTLPQGRIVTRVRVSDDVGLRLVNFILSMSARLTEPNVRSRIRSFREKRNRSKENRSSNLDPIFPFPPDAARPLPRFGLFARYSHVRSQIPGMLSVIKESWPR